MRRDDHTRAGSIWPVVLKSIGNITQKRDIIRNFRSTQKYTPRRKRCSHILDFRERERRRLFQHEISKMVQHINCLPYSKHHSLPGIVCRPSISRCNGIRQGVLGPRIVAKSRPDNCAEVIKDHQRPRWRLPAAEDLRLSAISASGHAERLIQTMLTKEPRLLPNQ
jgi:hypothetical protein